MAGPTAPAVPDYLKISGQQAQQNAAYNRVNQTNPFGSSNWTQTTGPDGQPIWSQNTTLAAPQQQQLDQNNQLSTQLLAKANGTAAGVAGSPFDTSGLPQVQSSIGGGSEATRQATIDALMSRINPDLQAQQSSLDSRLLNSGIERGSDAWMREQELQGRNANDQRVQAQLAGNTAMQQQQQLDLNQGNFANSASAQALQQAIATRNQPINEVNALRQSTGVTTPQFSAVPQVNSSLLDAALAQGNANNQQYQTQQTGYNNTLGGLVNLGSAFLGSKTGQAGLSSLGSAMGSGLSSLGSALGIGGAGAGAGSAATTAGIQAGVDAASLAGATPAGGMAGAGAGAGEFGAGFGVDAAGSAGLTSTGFADGAAAYGAEGAAGSAGAAPGLASLAQFLPFLPAALNIFGGGQPTDYGLGNAADSTLGKALNPFLGGIDQNKVLTPEMLAQMQAQAEASRLEQAQGGFGA